MSGAPVPFVNFSMAQFWSAGCSSLKKIPRYLTDGLPCEHPEDATKSSLCFVVGTSANLSWDESLYLEVEQERILTSTRERRLCRMMSIKHPCRMQQYAPNCSEWSYSANIVPRLSEPITTYALMTPGSGFATSLAIKASHLPSMDDTSSFVRFTISSMREDFPSVPTMIEELPREENEEVAVDVMFRSVGFTPVTC